MDLKTFFNTYLREDMLYRALILYGKEFIDINEFVEFKLSTLHEDMKLEKLVKHLSMSEVKTIENLLEVKPSNCIYHLENLRGLETLGEFEFVIAMNNGFVTHFDILNMIYNKLLELGLISESNMMLSIGEIQEPGALKKLEPIYTGPIYWLYNNLKSMHLRKIISRLGIAHYGSYKDEFIETVVQHLTTKEYLEYILEFLTKEALKLMEENIKDNVHIYERRTRWKEAEALGLLVKVHPDYLVMHDEVLQVMKTIDFKKLVSKIHLTTYFNAYHLHLTIEDVPSIKRDIIIPTRLNFYELIYVLKYVFGWTNHTNSHIEIGEYIIDELSDGSLFGSIIQVDYLLEKYHTFKFFYNSIDHYVVHISLIDTKSIDRPVPKVITYSGAIPIENIGDRNQLFYMLDVLKNKGHIDYPNVYEKARQRNYRERFPVTAINNQLSHEFSKDRPHTEK